MPRISTFMYADGFGIQNLPQGQLALLTNPQHIFTPQFVPGQFSFSTIIGILDCDFTKEHRIRGIFKDPKGNAVIDTGSTTVIMPADPKKSNIPPELLGAILNFDFRNVVLSKDGEYETEIFLDDISLGTFPILVKGLNNNEPTN
jgi:hypothetical protein